MVSAKKAAKVAPIDRRLRRQHHLTELLAIFEHPVGFYGLFQGEHSIEDWPKVPGPRILDDGNHRRERAHRVANQADVLGKQATNVDLHPRLRTGSTRHDAASDLEAVNALLERLTAHVLNDQAHASLTRDLFDALYEVLSAIIDRVIGSEGPTPLELLV
jgi:hypothetical protein